MKLIDLLKRLRYRLDDWIERLEARQPPVPCDDPMIEREVQRLSARIVEHYSTTNPYESYMQGR